MALQAAISVVASEKFGQFFQRAVRTILAGKGR